jgi:hypothetical protein
MTPQKDLNGRVEQRYARFAAAQADDFSDLRDFLLLAIDKRLKRGSDFTDAGLVRLATDERRRIEKQKKFDEAQYDPKRRDAYFGLAIGLIAAGATTPEYRGMVYGLSGLSSDEKSDAELEGKK